ncbi:hypothetical protein F4677DRAFT_246861 [Hypoxylon crocopeplum]|nr:hypothetical protein F4677DRAFT_246861 [Hypoxylon crocopeplum]
MAARGGELFANGLLVAYLLTYSITPGYCIVGLSSHLGDLRELREVIDYARRGGIVTARHGTVQRGEARKENAEKKAGASN